MHHLTDNRLIFCWIMAIFNLLLYISFLSHFLIWTQDPNSHMLWSFWKVSSIIWKWNTPFSIPITCRFFSISWDLPSSCWLLRHICTQFHIVLSRLLFPEHPPNVTWNPRIVSNDHGGEFWDLKSRQMKNI